MKRGDRILNLNNYQVYMVKDITKDGSMVWATNLMVDTFDVFLTADECILFPKEDK